MITKLNVGDKILTKKPHPCGSSEWTVVRLGADVKIKCNGCGRIVMLTPTDFERRLKKILGV
ncbi:MAG: DUF951 domain-containing protein [Clostridia bacterium]|nr:DUF951 domain-containing protein [Clostridia bacterium]